MRSQFPALKWLITVFIKEETNKQAPSPFPSLPRLSSKQALLSCVVTLNWSHRASQMFHVKTYIKNYNIGNYQFVLLNPFTFSPSPPTPFSSLNPSSTSPDSWILSDLHLSPCILYAFSTPPMQKKKRKPTNDFCHLYNYLNADCIVFSASFLCSHFIRQKFSTPHKADADWSWPQRINILQKDS